MPSNSASWHSLLDGRDPLEGSAGSGCHLEVSVSVSRFEVDRHR